MLDKQNQSVLPVLVSVSQVLHMPFQSPVHSSESLAFHTVSPFRQELIFLKRVSRQDFCFKKSSFVSDCSTWFGLLWDVTLQTQARKSNSMHFKEFLFNLDFKLHFPHLCLVSRKKQKTTKKRWKGHHLFLSHNFFFHYTLFHPKSLLSISVYLMVWDQRYELSLSNIHIWLSPNLSCNTAPSEEFMLKRTSGLTHGPSGECLFL